MQLKTEQSMLRFVFTSTGALYSSLKKRPWKMTRNSNCRAANFSQIERAGVWPESPGRRKTIVYMETTLGGNKGPAQAGWDFSYKVSNMAYRGDF